MLQSYNVTLYNDSDRKNLVESKIMIIFAEKSEL